MEQKAEAAEPLNAKAKLISVGKKLLDTTHSAHKAVTAVRGKVVAYWKSLSLPLSRNHESPRPRLLKRVIGRKVDIVSPAVRA